MLEVSKSDLVEFVNKWQLLGAENLFFRLKSFVDDWHSCNYHPVLEKTPVAVNPSALEKLILKFEPLLHTIRSGRRNGDAANVWEVAGLGNDEVRVSSVLAWFLDCHADHGQGDSLMSAILDKLTEKPAHFPASSTIQLKPYWVHVESCASGERSSRIDIEIEGEAFLIFIEVKIFAGETNNQLERYIEILQRKAGNRPYGIIFLSRGKKSSISHPLLLSISWKDIADTFHDYAINLPSNSYAKSLVSQFSKHIYGSIYEQ